MAEFVQMMQDWRRMCQQMDKAFGSDSCDHCPLGACYAIYESDGNEDYAALERKVAKWTAEHPWPVYPTWAEWLTSIGVYPKGWEIYQTPLKTAIPAEIAQKLGIEPKGEES